MFLKLVTSKAMAPLDPSSVRLETTVLQLCNGDQQRVEFCAEADTNDFDQDLVISTDKCSFAPSSNLVQ